MIYYFKEAKMGHFNIHRGVIFIILTNNSFSLSILNFQKWLVVFLLIWIQILMDAKNPSGEEKISQVPTVLKTYFKAN